MAIILQAYAARTCFVMLPRNYDDFNEFFWSPACLKYHYRDETDGNELPDDQYVRGHEGIPVYRALANAQKTYLEKRSWLHPLLAFHRLSEWHIVAFQILSMLAFSRHLLWDWPYALKSKFLLFC